MKTLQFITDDYLKKCKKLKPEQILEFLENFTELYYSASKKSKLISMKVPENLLFVFKQKCISEGLHYQTKIKELMKKWAAC
jgi:predicted DNA binding CopG/RHH family protein